MRTIATPTSQVAAADYDSPPELPAQDTETFTALMRRNILLAALPPDELSRLEPFLEPLHLAFEQPIYVHGDLFEWVYLPLDCVLSSVAIMNDGTSVEVYMTGREGVGGVSATFGDYHATCWTRVMIEGDALRIKSVTLHELCRQSDALQSHFMRSYRSVIMQVSQRAVCNGRHTLMQRLCTWLLMVQDRVGRNQLPLTHDFISSRLGTRRAGVTQAAVTLHQARAISYSRGKIRIDDRRIIETMCCECYRTQRQAFEIPKHFPEPSALV